MVIAWISVFIVNISAYWAVSHTLRFSVVNILNLRILAYVPSGVKAMKSPNMNPTFRTCDLGHWHNITKQLIRECLPISCIWQQKSSAKFVCMHVVHVRFSYKIRVVVMQIIVYYKYDVMPSWMAGKNTADGNG